MRTPDARILHAQRWLVATTEYAGLTPYTGGIGRHYAALLPALVRLGVEVDLVVFSDGAPRHPDLHGVKLVALHRTDGIAPVRALFAGARHVREAYLRRTYDRVFLPEWSALGAALPQRAPLLTNLATSAQLANEIAGYRLRDLPATRRPAVALQIAREHRQIRRSAGLIAISTAMLARTRAGRSARGRPAAVVRNCIDVDHVRSAAIEAPLPAGWPHGDEPVCLFLGRAERRKGVIEAVAAFGRLGDPRARLVLAGAGGDARFEPTRAELAAMLPPAVRGRVSWLGHVPGDELYRAIRSASLALCPSRWEGFGNVALEVKAIGTPLIVTSGSGFDDFCVGGEDCLMVPPRDPDALAAALRLLLDSPALGEALADRASAGIGRFAPDPVAADLIVAADGLLGPARGRDSE